MSTSLSDRLHGGWVLHKSAEKKDWTKVWCVLKRNGTLFFFNSSDTSLDTHIGTLHLSNDTSFHSGEGNVREGYRFELLISKKKKKFRVQTQYDRELWRSYIQAVITGRIPPDVILSPQDMQIIQAKFQQVPHTPALSPSSPPFTSPGVFGQTPPSASFAGRRPSDVCSASSLQWTQQRRPSVPSLGSTGTGSSGDGGFDPPDWGNAADVYHQSQDTYFSADSGVFLSTGGPFMTHKFDKGRNSTPSWFFENCNRELAEVVLNSCHHVGNTLMRVSTSSLSSGSYAISKKMESSEEIFHYEVSRVPQGYRINVQNITDTMTTLGEVMEAFIKISGSATTHPMKSNDLDQLGIKYDPYNRDPIGDHLVSAWSIESSDEEDYEVPHEQAPLPPALPVTTKLPSQTWSKEKTGNVRWQGHGDPAARTVGPADRRQKKPENTKPSVMEVSQTMEEEEMDPHPLPAGRPKPCLPASSGYVNDDVPSPDQSRVPIKGPALPPVPANRPKLPATASSPFLNAASPLGDPTSAPHNIPTATTTNSNDNDRGAGAEEGASQVLARWNKRSQSVPSLFPDPLDASVPAGLPPPPVNGPGEGGAGGQRGLPPPTLPKTVPAPPHPPAQPDVNERGKVPSSLFLTELTAKFRQKDAQRSEGSPHTTACAGGSSLSAGREEPEEEYEDLDQLYQNCSSRGDLE